MRHLLWILAVCLFISAPAFAAFNGPGTNSQGGFKGPGGPGVRETTAAQAANLPDDSLVILTGNILSQIPGTKDKYNFRDDSGEIILEISQKRFMGQEVTPNNKVRIHGEVDKDWGKPVEIDVKGLEVIK